MPARPLLFELRDPLRRSDLPDIYARACAQLAAGRHGLLEVDVARVRTDAVAVDAIGRLALAARRHNCPVRLRGAGEALYDLLALSGLRDVLEG
jgi:ABC-type transporter Mla MlaB component